MASSEYGPRTDHPVGTEVETAVLRGVGIDAFAGAPERDRQDAEPKTQSPRRRAIDGKSRGPNVAGVVSWFETVDGGCCLTNADAHAPQLRRNEEDKQ